MVPSADWDKPRDAASGWPMTVAAPADFADVTARTHYPELSDSQVENTIQTYDR